MPGAEPLEAWPSRLAGLQVSWSRQPACVQQASQQLTTESPCDTGTGMCMCHVMHGEISLTSCMASKDARPTCYPPVQAGHFVRGLMPAPILQKRCM